MAYPAGKTFGATIPIQAAATDSAASGGRGWLGTAFHDLIDVVNPLQHLPVVGTLYRAITGDKIGSLEKIAGDTLYGGLWGGVSSLADTAFEAVTGKDFGATMLALVTGGDDAKPDAKIQVASAAPSTSASQAAATPDVAAFSQALSAKGVTGDTATRALSAYRRATSTVAVATP